MWHAPQLCRCGGMHFRNRMMGFRGVEGAAQVAQLPGGRPRRSWASDHGASVPHDDTPRPALHHFPAAALANRPKFNSLTALIDYLAVQEGSSPTRTSQAVSFLDAPGGQSVSCLSQLLGATRIPWLTAPSSIIRAHKPLPVITPSSYALRTLVITRRPLK